MEHWTSDFWEENVDMCERELKKDGYWEKIPLMNRRQSQNLKEGQFVRFCGMIQDTYDPVYYLASYEVHNLITNEKAVRSGKYKDSIICAEHERILFDSDASVNQERRSVYCISVPAVNLWAQYKKSESILNIHCDSQQFSDLGLKRNAEEAVGTLDDSRASSSYESSKRQCLSANVTEADKREQPMGLNLPIPNIQAEACLINFYDIEENLLKINDVIEVAGFLSYDPALVTSSIDGIIEEIPPPSLVPRIHAVALRPLNYNFNPLLTPQASLNDDVSRLRDELKLVLTQLLLGDMLAADYLICHLISHIYLRQDVLVLGKFSLNLSNIPHSFPEYTSRLYHFLENLVVKSHYLPMTLETMNTVNMIPRKNYETNRLVSGLLQLSNKTHLVLDETLLQPGQLNEKGVRNCRALASVISNQRLEYDFQFYPVEFYTDIPVLILSEGKSMLPSDYHVKVSADPACISTVHEVFTAAAHYLKEPLLSQLRVYVSLVSTSDFDLTPDVQQIVQEDFVEMRRDQPNTSAQDLHSLLVLARLLSLSHGCQSLTKEFWETAKLMENQRKGRLTNS